VGEEKPRWEYHLTNDYDRKPDGWYAYDERSSNEVEQLYLDRQDNASLTTRFIHSTSSGYTYQVNLEQFSQMNTTSRKVRPIRRVCGNNILTPRRDAPCFNTTQKAKTVKKMANSNTSSSSSSSSATAAAPKKKTKSKGKKQPTEVVVALPPPPPPMTLNLRQQYVKGMLSDRSARKYLKTLEAATTD
jgi:hypothetical protein